MGWKRVKEHYGIHGPNRIVHVMDGEIHIGVAYVLDLMKISADGVLLKRDDFLHSEDFARYAREMDADPRKLRELVLEPDTFEGGVAVYTFDGGQIIEKRCDALGFPNVTHDGLLMFDNRFSADKDTVIAWARKEAAAGISLYESELQLAEERLQLMHTRLQAQRDALAMLDRDYPVEPNEALRKAPA